MTQKTTILKHRLIFAFGWLVAAGACGLNAQETPEAPQPPTPAARALWRVRPAVAPMPPAAPLPPEDWEMTPLAAVPMPAMAPLPAEAWEVAAAGPMPGMLFAMQAPSPPAPPALPGGRSARDAERAYDRVPRPPRDMRDRGDRYYSTGKSYLDRHEYDKAVDAFNRVIDEKGARADGALYWRAYADNKLGKRTEALASLAELQKNFSGSRWLEDAKALQVELQQASGQPVSPESATDEDLKLLALNSMANSDPERTIPMLEKLLKSGNSARVKERALFVLAQGRSQKGRELMSQVARGNYNPDLQLKAVEYLGVFGGKDNQQALSDVYKSTSDVSIKRRILSSFLVCGCRDSLLAVAKGETNPALRIEAIRLLGAMGASADVMQLYSPDAPYEVKRAVLQGLFMSGNADKILEIARTDKDAKMRLEAIRQLGPMGRSRSGDALTSLYSKESDPQLRREILNGLYVQGNATALIDAARKETDPNLKREAVQRLSSMHSKEATDYLVELLNK